MKLTRHQLEVLAALANAPYNGTMTASAFYHWCGSAKTARALLSSGTVEGNDIPARYISITEAGRAALPQNKPESQP